MGLVTQYSRLLHHTITGASGSTFSVPPSEDFTDGSWTVYDLNLSEIGVNETDEKAYIRIGSTIKEFQFTGGTGGGGGGTVSVYADNGLTLTGATISLGGTLSVNTVIEGASNSMTLGSLSSRLRAFGVETYDSIFLRDDDTFNLSILDMSAAGGAAALSSGEQITGAGSEFVAGAYGKLYVEATTGADIFRVELDAESLTNKRMLITDTISSRGFQYAADYSAQFITHSLITKKYVDSKTYSLVDVLSVDNDASTYSIVMGTGLIESSGGLSTLGLTDQEIVVTTPVIMHANGISGTPIFYENLEIQTTTASTLSIFTFPGASLSQDAAISFDAIVNGFNAVSGDSYFAKVFAGFRSISANITQISVTNITELSTFTSSVTSDFVTDGTDVFLDVTGESGQTINWTVRINYQYAY